MSKTDQSFTPSTHYTNGDVELRLGRWQERLADVLQAIAAIREVAP